MSDAPEIPEVIREMNPEAFKAHKYHPQTVILRTYLADFRDELVRGHTKRWLNNNELPNASDPKASEDEIRFRAQVIQDILDLEPEDIRFFYFKSEPPPEDELDAKLQDQPKVIEEET